jgi:hypothetical protein
MSTRIILALTILATGAAACSDSKKDTTPAQIGTGTTISTGSGTGVSTGVGTGAATDTGTGVPTNTGTGVATNTGTGVPTSTGTGVATNTGTGVATSPGTSTTTSVGTGTMGTPTKEGHLAIINASPAASATPVDVAGAAPPTYDPDTKTCK